MDNLEKMVKNSIKIAKSIFLGKAVNKGERGKRRGEGVGKANFWIVEQPRQSSHR